MNLGIDLGLKENELFTTLGCIDESSSLGDALSLNERQVRVKKQDGMLCVIHRCE